MPWGKTNIFADDYAWAAATATVYSDLINYNNAPKELGFYSLFFKFTTAAGEYSINYAPFLQFTLDGGSVYGDAHAITNDEGATSVDDSGGGTIYFEARLDTQSWWKLNYGFRIYITRTLSGVASLAIVINNSILVYI